LFVENGKAKIRSLEWRFLILVEQEEILRLEIPVNDSHGMACVDDLNDCPQQGRRSALSIMPLGNNTVKKFSSCAQLHNQMHRVLIFVSTLELDDIGLTRQVVHDLNLPPDVLDVLLVRQLSLGYGFARELLARHLVCTQMGDPELSPSKLFSDRICRPDVFHWAAQHGAYMDRLRSSRLSVASTGVSAGCYVAIVIANIVWMNVLAVFGVEFFLSGSGRSIISLALRATVAHAGRGRSERARERERERESGSEKWQVIRQC